MTVGAVVDALRADNPRIGAIACFVGVVRDLNDDAAVSTMTLEHYPGMTERALEAIGEEALARWDLVDLAVVHRVGRLEPTDPIVLVAVASARVGQLERNRGEALDQHRIGAARANVAGTLRTLLPDGNGHARLFFQF